MASGSPGARNPEQDQAILSQIAEKLGLDPRASSSTADLAKAIQAALPGKPHGEGQGNVAFGKSVNSLGQVEIREKYEDEGQEEGATTEHARGGGVGQQDLAPVGHGMGFPVVNISGGEASSNDGGALASVGDAEAERRHEQLTARLAELESEETRLNPELDPEEGVATAAGQNHGISGARRTKPEKSFGGFTRGFLSRSSKTKKRSGKKTKRKGKKQQQQEQEEEEARDTSDTAAQGKKREEGEDNQSKSAPSLETEAIKDGVVEHFRAGSGGREGEGPVSTHVTDADADAVTSCACRLPSRSVDDGPRVTFAPTTRAAEKTASSQPPKAQARRVSKFKAARMARRAASAAAARDEM